MYQFRKYFFLEKAITIDFPEDWRLIQKDENVFEIKFPHGPYPVLGCYVNCFDGPKMNSDEKIRAYLLKEIESTKTIEKRGGKTYFLNYEFNTKDEKLMMWKVLNYLYPRNFRELRFSLAWPDTNDANYLVEDLLKSMPKILQSIKFSSKKTKYDDIAELNYKLQNIKLKKHVFWESLNIFFPYRWIISNENSEKFANLIIDDKENFNLFFEYFNINRKENDKKNDEVITNFIEEITQEVNVLNQSLIKADNNNYIFSFYSKENINNKEVINRIWYRLLIKKSRLVIASFVFSYKKDQELIGKEYFKKIDSLIKSSELN